MIHQRVYHVATVALFVATGLSLASEGCKQEDAPKAPQAGGTTFTSAPPALPSQPLGSAINPTVTPPVGAKCTSATACNPAQQDLLITRANGQLVGVAGQPVNWVFYGRDLSSLNTTQIAPELQGSDRRVAVVLSGLPHGAQLSPMLNGTAVFTQESIIWTPSAAGSGTLQIELRDYDRCMITEPSPAAACNVLSHTTYDLPTTVPWQIVQGPPPKAAAVNVNPEQPGQLLGSVIGAFIGSLFDKTKSGAPSGGATFSYSNRSQVYPDCKTNGGSGYGCNWTCGSLWCSKDNQNLSDSSICTVTKDGGPSC
jgi:hypothetical protein